MMGALTATLGVAALLDHDRPQLAWFAGVLIAALACQSVYRQQRRVLAEIAHAGPDALYAGLVTRRRSRSAADTVRYLVVGKPARPGGTLIVKHDEITWNPVEGTAKEWLRPRRWPITDIADISLGPTLAGRAELDVTLADGTIAHFDTRDAALLRMALAHLSVTPASAA
jgi:hypothetical protein